ncbi:hypothetical protein KC930_00405 [Candidatus Saccharibacteria bacterium]|nr:hypothetical protein [Candidatus Saccharibacteria bacterium]
MSQTILLSEQQALLKALHDVRKGSNKRLVKNIRRTFWAIIQTSILVILASAILNISHPSAKLNLSNNAQAVSSIAVVHSDSPDPNAILEQVNNYRSQAGLKELVMDSRLQVIAEMRAKEMVSSGVYSHKNADGGIFMDEINESGYYPATGCENLSLEPSKDVVASVNGWLASTAGHRDCLYDSQSQLAGYAAVKFTEAELNGQMMPYYLVVAIHTTDF